MIFVLNTLRVISAWFSVISGRFVLPYMGLPNFGDSRHSFLSGMTLFARFHREFRDFRHDFRDFVLAHSSRDFAVIFVILDLHLSCQRILRGNLP